MRYDHVRNILDLEALTVNSQKVLTYVVPCYNSADYMDNCIQSLLDASAEHPEEVEILIVDDGSQGDDTPGKADEWARCYPENIRAIHQENLGHGGAVNTGLANASGVYFKVVDSDDWVDLESAKLMLELLRTFAVRSAPTDMVLCNYVYENQETGQELMDYRGLLPGGVEFGWDDVKKFPVDRYILMHSVFYRTQLLRDCGIELPEHTYYVDNIFVYVPLPYVETMFYLDVDLYRYFIGRSDQSVNQDVMAGRIDQQLLITRVMIDAYDLDDDIDNGNLRGYMESYLLMMMVICSVFSLLSGRSDRYMMREDIWRYLEQHNPGAYERMRSTFLGRGVNLKGKAGEKVILAIYSVARRIFKFN